MSDMIYVGRDDGALQVYGLESGIAPTPAVLADWISATTGLWGLGLYGYTALSANFSAFPTGGSPPLQVQFQDKSIGDPETWLWDFGDTYGSTMQNPTHSYSTGTYSPSLIVTGVTGMAGFTGTNYIHVLTAIVADFSATPLSGGCPLLVNFTDLTSGSPVSWLWNFGDGGTSTSQNPSHTYTEAGTYTVTLTVDGGTSTKTRTNYITASIVANFSGTPTSGDADLSVSFTDLSTGTPTSWSWDFGDGGTSTLQNPTHIYAVAGVYTVILISSRGLSSDTETKTGYITVNVVADFSATPTSGDANLSVVFTDLSLGVPTSWLWHFGDGATSTLQNPTHVYAVAGTYTVILACTRGSSTDTKTETDYITVYPVANFSADPVRGKNPLFVFFTDQSKGVPTAWLWNFGDGGVTGTSQNPSHTYAPGTYSPALTVIASTGSSTLTRTDYITVDTKRMSTTDTAVGESNEALTDLKTYGTPNVAINGNKPGVSVSLPLGQTQPSGFKRDGGPSVSFG